MGWFARYVDRVLQDIDMQYGTQLYSPKDPSCVEKPRLKYEPLTYGKPEMQQISIPDRKKRHNLV
jgi:hypothetical protein